MNKKKVGTKPEIKKPYILGRVREVGEKKIYWPIFYAKKNQ